MQYLIIFLFIIAVIVAVPILVIVALNTLFPFAIPYTFGTWLATFFLMAVFAGSSHSSK